MFMPKKKRLYYMERFKKRRELHDNDYEYNDDLRIDMSFRVHKDIAVKVNNQIENSMAWIEQQFG